jgi:hypothetical protein
LNGTIELAISGLTSLQVDRRAAVNVNQGPFECREKLLGRSCEMALLQK